MPRVLGCIKGGRKRSKGRMRLPLVTHSAICAAMMFIITIGSAENLKYYTLSAHTFSIPSPSSRAACPAHLFASRHYMLPHGLAISQTCVPIISSE